MRALKRTNARVIRHGDTRREREHHKPNVRQHNESAPSRPLCELLTRLPLRSLPARCSLRHPRTRLRTRIVLISRQPRVGVFSSRCLCSVHLLYAVVFLHVHRSGGQCRWAGRTGSVCVCQQKSKPSTSSSRPSGPPAHRGPMGTSGPPRPHATHAIPSDNYVLTRRRGVGGSREHGTQPGD